MTVKKYKNSFINQLMLCGNKWKSELILLKIFKNFQKTQKTQTNLILKFSIINSSPYFSIKQVQKKKKKIEFPFLLNNTLRIFYSLKNISKKKKKKDIYLNLIESVNNQGVGFDLKKTIHKDAFLKKKVANYRWF